jgi:LemA protein
MALLITLGVCLALVAVVAFVITQVYNRLVELKNRCHNAFAQIEVQLKRRYDLIPNLVEAVKGYLTHERETLQGVIEARNQAAAGLKAIKDPGNAESMKALMGSENALTGALGRMNFVMEAYPELKANGNIAELTEELSHTENRIAFSRQSYNDLTMAFNTYRQSFPTIIFAAMFGYTSDRKMLEFADSEKIQEAPQVSFAS